MKFTFTIWYFKPNGKFYTEAEVEWEIKCLWEGPKVPPTPWMTEAVDYLKSWDDNRGGLPGLIGKTWEGPVLINCEQGFPVLILEGIR